MISPLFSSLCIFSDNPYANNAPGIGSDLPSIPPEPINENIFMFQSHIAGKTNDNNWTKDNYENFRQVITFLKENYKFEFKLLKELL